MLYICIFRNKLDLKQATTVFSYCLSSLIFAGKAGAYQSMVTNLGSKYQTKADVIGSGKYSSLLQCANNYGRKVLQFMPQVSNVIKLLKPLFTNVRNKLSVCPWQAFPAQPTVWMSQGKVLHSGRLRPNLQTLVQAGKSCQEQTQKLITNIYKLRL